MYAFVSYSRSDADGAFIQRLKQSANRANVRMWIDTASLEYGEPWSEAVDHAIADAGAVLVVATEASVTSAWVNYEWAFALGARVPILPLVLLEPERLHPRLQKLHHIDCRSNEDDRLGECIDWAKQRLYPEYRSTRKLKQLLASTAGPEEKNAILEKLARIQHPDAERAILDYLAGINSRLKAAQPSLSRREIDFEMDMLCRIAEFGPRYLKAVRDAYLSLNYDDCTNQYVKSRLIAMARRLFAGYRGGM